MCFVNFLQDRFFGIKNQTPHKKKQQQKTSKVIHEIEVFHQHTYLL